MTEPRADRIDVDARLEKMAGSRMANDVRTDPLSLDRRYRDTQLCDIAFDECVNAVTRQRLSATVQEKVLLGGTLPREMTEVREGCGPERAATLLVSFAR